MNQTPKTLKELRTFGLIMSAPLTLIGCFLWWKGRIAAPYVLIAAGIFMITGLLTPGLLRPIEKLWMKFAEILGAVMTRVILTMAYYLVITPLGLLLRLLGKDLLGLHFDTKSESYWVHVEMDGPSTRPDKPY